MFHKIYLSLLFCLLCWWTYLFTVRKDPVVMWDRPVTSRPVSAIPMADKTPVPFSFTIASVRYTTNFCIVTSNTDPAVVVVLDKIKFQKLITSPDLLGHHLEGKGVGQLYRGQPQIAASEASIH